MHADVWTQVVVDDGDADALFDERRRDARLVVLVERAPVAAVYEQQRAAGRFGRKEVERLLRPAAIAQPEPRFEARPD